MWRETLCRTICKHFRVLSDIFRFVLNFGQHKNLRRPKTQDLLMNIISFATEESDWKKPRLGIILHDGTRDLGYRLDCERLFEPSHRPTNPLSWFDLDGEWLQRASQTAKELVKDEVALDRAKANGLLVSSKDAYWFAPVPRPGKLICIGLNYRDHAAESNMAIPERPVIFSKFPTCVIAPGEPVVIPSTSHQVDYEAELAVVIGRRRRTLRRAVRSIMFLATQHSTTSARRLSVC